MKQSALGAGALLCLGTLLGACSSTQPVETVTIMNQHSCANVSAGITASTLTAVRSLRRSRLLPPPEDAPIQAQEELPALEATRVFVISKGPQPTPGYGFELSTLSLRDARSPYPWPGQPRLRIRYCRRWSPNPASPWVFQIRRPRRSLRAIKTVSLHGWISDSSGCTPTLDVDSRRRETRGIATTRAQAMLTTANPLGA